MVNLVLGQNVIVDSANVVEQLPPNAIRFANHSPKKATKLALLLPSAGQIYNQRYWKAPIVWLGFGYLGYQIASNNKNYIAYRDAYRFRTDENPATTDPFPSEPDRNLQLKRDEFRIERDKNFLFLLAFYGLQAIDARVDAHLRTFDVSNNLSLKLEPFTPLVFMAQSQAFGITPGVTLRLSFK